MNTSPSQRIGIVTCEAEKLADYSPTVDKGVGDILAKVREAGLEDDTLIFF